MTVLQSLQESFDSLQGIERPLCEVNDSKAWLSGESEGDVAGSRTMSHLSGKLHTGNATSLGWRYMFQAANDR